jgi:heptosyltransferase I
MNSAPRILIIKLSSLGDILHTLPAFSVLRATFPDAKIDWLTAKKTQFLTAAVQGIDAIHVLDADPLRRFPPQRAGWRNFRNLIRQLRACRYDYAIDFQGLLKTAIIGSMTGARVRLGFSGELVRERPAHWLYHRTLANPEKQVHVVKLNCMLAELAGARGPDSPIHFCIPPEDERSVALLLQREQLRDFVVINPGGGWATKRWSPEGYGRLAKRIQDEAGFPVAVTTGPGEEGLFQSIAESCGNPLPRHMPVSFLQLIPLLRQARLFIGGDTGPFHLACALGTAVVGIFGPTSIVRNGPWQCLGEAVTLDLPCGSCYGRVCTTGNACMDIPVDEVYARVIRRLGEKGGHSGWAPTKPS